MKQTLLLCEARAKGNSKVSGTEIKFTRLNIKQNATITIPPTNDSLILETVLCGREWVQVYCVRECLYVCCLYVRFRLKRSKITVFRVCVCVRL